MASSSLKFDLSSIDISVLHLLPGTGTDPIICTTETLPLKSNPTYETLSYVWGSSQNPRQITCNGSPTHVTENLYLALTRLRLPNAPRKLWIDQLCIDQSDEIEKSRQVSVMRSIYKESAGGLIWLGEIPPENEACFSEEDVEAVFQGLVDIDASLTPEALPNSGQVLLALFASSQAKWQGVKWWQRIWTIQEAKLPASSTLLWGRHTISFNLLRRVGKRLTNEPSTQQRFDGFFKLGPLGNDFCMPIMNLQIVDPAPITGPLYRWRPRQATNPLDKVYALMGLLPDGAFPSVPYCDYTLSAKELYTRVTFDLIKHHRGLLPLCGRRGEPRATEGLPSWVVDWTHAEDPAKRTTDYYGHCWRYTEPELTDGGAGIALQGIPFDRIAVLGTVNTLVNYHQLDGQAYDHQTRSTINSWASTFSEWQATHPTSSPYLNTTYTPQDAFHRLLVGDLVYHGDQPRYRITLFPEEVVKVEEYIRGGWTQGIANSVRDMARSQAFFITERGYLGIGPPDAMVGDEVWVLFCGNVPQVLRGRGGDEFEYVGDAYVQGIMDGEAVEGVVEGRRVVLK